MDKHKVKRHRISDTKTDNRERQENYRTGTVSNELMGGLNQFYGHNLALSFWSGTKHLVGCSIHMITHPLTRQWNSTVNKLELSEDLTIAPL